MILQHNVNKMNIIKVENDVDVLSEEDYIGMKTDGIYIPSSFSIEKVEPEVSLVLKLFLWLFVCVCVCMCVQACAWTYIHACAFGRSLLFNVRGVLHMYLMHNKSII
jgi:uncharacterized membrane protein